MTTAVLFYEDADCMVLTEKFIGESLDDADSHFKGFLDEVDGTFINITYVDSDDCNVLFKTEAL